jgi:hypothetical protein
MPDGKNSDDLISDENTLLNHYMDEIQHGTGEYFEHIGLPRDATWGHFRRHYDKDGLPNIPRVAEDMANFPPIKARIEELKAKLGKNIISLDDWLNKDID